MAHISWACQFSQVDVAVASAFESSHTHAEAATRIGTHHCNSGHSGTNCFFAYVAKVIIDQSGTI